MILVYGIRLPDPILIGYVPIEVINPVEKGCSTDKLYAGIFLERGDVLKVGHYDLKALSSQYEAQCQIWLKQLTQAKMREAYTRMSSRPDESFDFRERRNLELIQAAIEINEPALYCIS